MSYRRGDWRLAWDVAHWLLLRPLAVAAKQVWLGLRLIVTAPWAAQWTAKLEALCWWTGHRYFRCGDCGRLCNTWATWCWHSAERIDGSAVTVGKCHRCDPPKRR